jgi:subtilisin family serine protease
MFRFVRGGTWSLKQRGVMSNTLKWSLVWILIAGVFPGFSPITAETKSKSYVAAEVLVKFKPDADQEHKQSARDALGASLTQTLKPIAVEHWRLPEGITTEDALEFLKGLLYVEYAEPNYLYTPQTFPDDPHFSLQWYLHNTGQTVTGENPQAGADISAPEAWDIETGSPDMIIAVIDSGVAYDHPDLNGNVWTHPGEIPGNDVDDDGNGYADDIHGWDFVNDDNNPSDYSRDLYGDGHGTHVAGIIAARGNNGIGVSGVMWQARIMPLQVFDLFETNTFTEAVIQNINVISAIVYAADNGARIINCSFGGPSNSQSQYDAFAYADQKGVLVVTAAGNEDQNNDYVSTYPANYNLPNIITVAATDGRDQLAFYSNYGPNTVDVAAPGGGDPWRIYSTIPPRREILFSEDFESGADRWLKQSLFEDWSLTFNPIAGSTVMQDSAGNYHDNENSFIQTIAPIRVGNYRGLHIQFDAWFRLENDYDFLWVEGSEDGINFSLNFPITGYATGFSKGIETLLGWGSENSLGNEFFMRFRLTSDESGNYEGVFLDDIQLTGIRWEFLGDEYDYKMGTSMAAPVVAGIAGLVWSHRPEFSHYEVKSAIINSVDRLEALNGLVSSGGRVNAAKALTQAEPEEPGPEEPTPESGGGGGGCFLNTLSAM